MTTCVDLGLVRDILTDAMKAVDTLDRTEILDTTLGNKPAVAHLNREMLNLADQLGLAAALVRNEYWSGKGEMSYDIA